ncbi:MAG: Protein of unknown function (DUF1640) [Glomeribacter sp. 1016415]|nr:Protein of unknown function (DUF1640) [Glomeribacter sp. 1016415]
MLRVPDLRELGRLVMAMAIFDTLKFSKRMQEAGVPTAQAEAEAEVLSEIFAINLQELPTKGDLLAAKEELQHEIKDVRNEIRAVRNDLSKEIKEVRSELSNEIKDVRNELSNEIKDVRNELSNEINGVRNELSNEINGVRNELNNKIDGVRNELNNKIDGVRNELSHEIKDLRFGLLKWIIGLAIAQSGLLSVFKFWPVGLTA